MIAFKLGEKIPLSLSSNNGGRLIYVGGLTVFLAGLRNPSIREVRQMREGRLKIGIAQFERLGVLLLEYDGGLTFEPSFDVGIERTEDVPELSTFDKNQRIPISIVGYDLESELIFSLRVCTLSPVVGDLYANMLREQSENRISVKENRIRAASMYARIQRYEDMKRSALAMDIVGT